MTSAQTIVTRDRTFLGEPRALAYLAFTEAWERFSYYGMTALLVLYMSGELFLPGHVEHVAGFASFRAGLEGLFGPMTPVALASQIFGLYTGFVYFTPVFGGIIADRWIGKRNAVVIGALLMSAGHIAMAFDQSFLLALVLLVVGCGLLKGNISAQVGALYRDGDGAGRTRGFAIFSTAINIGAVAGPLACGLLAQLYGWHAGFGLAGGSGPFRSAAISAKIWPFQNARQSWVSPPVAIWSMISSAMISGTPIGLALVSTTTPSCSVGSSATVVDAPALKAPECAQRRNPR